MVEQQDIYSELLAMLPSSLQVGGNVVLARDADGAFPIIETKLVVETLIALIT